MWVCPTKTFKAFQFFFAIHVVVILLAQLLVSCLVRIVGPFYILKAAVLVQLISLLHLLFMEWMFDVALPIFIVAMMLEMAGGALINTSALAMLVAFFQRLTGSVTSLMSSFRFFVGATLGVVSVWLFNHTLIPIVATMLLSSVLCFLFAWTLPQKNLQEVASESRFEGL